MEGGGWTNHLSVRDSCYSEERLMRPYSSFGTKERSNLQEKCFNTSRTESETLLPPTPQPLVVIDNAMFVFYVMLISNKTKWNNFSVYKRGLGLVSKQHLLIDILRRAHCHTLLVPRAMPRFSLIILALLNELRNPQRVSIKLKKKDY